MNITANKKQLAVIGDPIGHSLSPKIQREFISLSGENAEYTAIRVTKDELSGMMKTVREKMSGINVTAPHKIEVMKYLDEVSDEARLYGAVNTVVNKNGKLIGYNTDAKGFYSALLRGNAEASGKDILVLGAGGAAKSAVVKLAAEGARTVTVVNRTKERAVALGEYIKASVGFNISTERELSHYDIVINTTSAGMKPQLEVLPCEDLSFIDENTMAVDMIYNPPETRFLREARKRGANILNGLGMLIYQGIFAYEIFTDTKLPPEAFERARAVLAE